MLSEILVIERDSEMITNDTITLKEDIVIRLRCLAQQVLPPLTMEWFVDSKRVYTESFFQYFSEETNFSISLEIYTGTIITSITCVAYGNYIQNMSRSVSVVEGEDIRYNFTFFISNICTLTVDCLMASQNLSDTLL